MAQLYRTAPPTPSRGAQRAAGDLVRHGRAGQDRLGVRGDLVGALFAEPQFLKNSGGHPAVGYRNCPKPPRLGTRSLDVFEARTAPSDTKPR